MIRRSAVTEGKSEDSDDGGGLEAKNNRFMKSDGEEIMQRGSSKLGTLDLLMWGVG